ncbi:MAG: hypothetical protein ACRERD_09275 [Candidatus Binatia bacterium]
MKAKVTEHGVMVPKELLAEAEEVEIRKENDRLVIIPAVGAEEGYEAPRSRALALLKHGFHLGGIIRATRDEWHER